MLSQKALPVSLESAEPVSRRVALAGIGGGAALAAAASMLGMTAGVAAQAGSGTPPSGGNYLVIRQYQLAEGVDAATIMQQIQDGFVPIIREVPGFVAYYYLHDAGSGATASISIFADETGSDESTERAASWIEEHFEGVYAGPPDVMAGTLGISEVAS